MSELLPCPFCGKVTNDRLDAGPDRVPVSIGFGSNEEFAVWCRSCDALGPEAPNGDKAITAWNARISTPASAATGGGVAEASAMPWQVYEEPCATRDDFMREMAIQAEHTIVADPTLYLVHDGQGKTVASTWGGAKAKANAYAIAAMSAAPPPPAQAADGWRPKVGDRVQVSSASRWADEWKGWYGFVAGIAAKPGTAEIDITVSTYWPPDGLGDLTDGFEVYDLVSAPPAPEAGS